MVTKRQKQVAGVASAALLLLGSVFAWANVTQHKTNESLGDSSSPNDVTLVENFEPTDSWEKGAEKLKEISVKNNGKTEKGAEPVYVRINLKEYLEFTKKEEVFSDVRYAVKTDGEFAKFESEADAKVYAAANGLSEADVVLVPTTVHEGDNQYFIKTKAGAFHGQYGKFLLLEMKADAAGPQPIYGGVRASDDAKRDPNGDGDESDGKHQEVTHGEDNYAIQKFDKTVTGDVNDHRQYPGIVTGTGIATGKDLKDYIKWHLGEGVAILGEDFDPEAAGHWVIDPATGWAYWSVALEPGQETDKFLKSMTLINSPKNVAFYYAIHADLEAVDYEGIDGLADLSDKVKDAWLAGGATEAAPIARVHFRNYDDTADVLPDVNITAANPDLTIPDAPKADHYFLGWAESASATNAATLYVPSTYTDVRLTLNVPDKTYLGYTVKSEHELTSITADKTLYAVYYKAKDAVTADGDDFIWANAIWRNLKTDMDTNVAGNQALAIKANALTQKEATGSGATTGYYTAKFIESSRTTYFSDTGENGYEAADNNVRLANTTYYDNLSTTDKTSVNKVALNNPSFAEFKSGQSFSANNYDFWQWNDYYKDTRFETTVSETGSKQAFALSYGDIHTLAGVGAGDNRTSKLNFTGSNTTNFCLRSPCRLYNLMSFVNAGTGSFDSGNAVNYALPVRPALSLTIQ